MLDPTFKLALETIQLSKQALVFCPSRASAEKTAEEIAKLTSFQHPELEQKILQAVSTPTKQCRRLSNCVRKGIAFHHAGLVRQQRELIEDEFRKGTVKIICSTPTLAMGLNLPAFRVIMKSLKRYSEQWGNDWIPVLEYYQMTGRAGRPGYETYGQAISIAQNEAEKEEIYQRYICGQPEDIYSKLAAEPVLRTYLLSLIATNIIRDEKSMNDFFSRTFWAQQYGDLKKLQGITRKMLALLERWELVKQDTPASTGDFVPARTIAPPALNNTLLRATPLGKRISELYLDPLTARHFLDSLSNFNEKKNVFSFLQMICFTLEIRPLLRVKRKEEEVIQEEWNKHSAQLLMKEPAPFDPDHDDFLNSFKTALFLEDWINEKDEDFLMEKYDIRPGEIRAKLEVADWLLYSVTELAQLQHQLQNKLHNQLQPSSPSSSPFQEAAKELRKLRFRVQQGVKEELLPLLRLRGIGRVRGRKLYAQGVKDLGDVKKVDLTTLAQLLGSKLLAEDIKKQLGEEIEAVPEGRRKGQLSIFKYGG